MTARRDTYRDAGIGKQAAPRITPTGDARSPADAERMSSFTVEPRGATFVSHAELAARDREAAALLRPVIVAERPARPTPVTNTRTSDAAAHDVRSDARRSGTRLRTIGLALAGSIAVGAFVAFIVVHGPAGWTYWLYNRGSTAFVIR
ncbi:hypothetical protein [Burkholderia latens]|uniref:hypothetical protein n=1 Tax=Burkholderia latens TaxID=488446 RepID=UPI0015895AB3|nr:hypothetical protein [Burkholderia latens]